MEPCTQTHRIDRLESDVRELQKTDRKHTDDITGLKEGMAESRVMQKMTLEKVAEIKMMITAKRETGKEQSPNKEWIDLIKWVMGGTIIAIVTWMIKSNM